MKEQKQEETKTPTNKSNQQEEPCKNDNAKKTHF